MTVQVNRLTRNTRKPIFIGSISFSKGPHQFQNNTYACALGINIEGKAIELLLETKDAKFLHEMLTKWVVTP